MPSARMQSPDYRLLPHSFKALFHLVRRRTRRTLAVPDHGFASRGKARDHDGSKSVSLRHLWCGHRRVRLRSIARLIVPESPPAPESVGAVAAIHIRIIAPEAGITWPRGLDRDRGFNGRDNRCGRFGLNRLARNGSVTRNRSAIGLSHCSGGAGQKESCAKYGTDD